MWRASAGRSLRDSSDLHLQYPVSVAEMRGLSAASSGFMPTFGLCLDACKCIGSRNPGATHPIASVACSRCSCCKCRRHAVCVAILAPLARSCTQAVMMPGSYSIRKQFLCSSRDSGRGTFMPGSHKFRPTHGHRCARVLTREVAADPPRAN